MGLKGKIEAIIYAAEEPITLGQIAFLMKDAVLQELAVERESAAAAQAEQESTAAQDFNEPPANTVETVEQLAPSNETAGEPKSDPTQGEAPAEDAPVQTQLSTGELTEPEATAVAGAGTEPVGPAESAAAQYEAEASENAKPAVVAKKKKNEVPSEVKARVRLLIEELIADCANSDRGIEVRQLAGGYRMATKPEHHDIVKAFAKSLKPPLRLSLPALETLAVVAYKQPVTAPEVSEIRGVDSQGVMATLLDRKLVTTAGRKAVIGRPILYKTTKEFLLRFGLNDTSELPSMEEFEKLAQKEFFNAEVESEGTAAVESEPELPGDEFENEMDGTDGTDSSASATEHTEATDSAETQAEALQETVEQDLSDAKLPE